MAAEAKKPNVLVLGGCGFIGRNFVQYLVDNKLAEIIRVCDKNLPATSYLAAEHKRAFDEKNVQFVQADLTRDDHVARAFKDVKFDYVVNLCGETRFGMAEEEYKKKSLEPAVKVGKAAAEAKVTKFVELSTAQIYEPDAKRPAPEDAKVAPWTILAKYRYEAEKALQKIEGLPLVILRPALVYGLGDLTSISPRMVCAAVYQDRKEKMKFLWDRTLKLNTVHVEDVCAAIWFACTTAAVGSIYNLADGSNADQGMVNGFLGEIFGIEVGFLGAMLSGVAAKMALDSIAEEANEKHVPGWTKLCQAHRILNTPLSAYIDKELLKNNSLCVDGSAITAAGFRYRHPALTKEALLTIVQKLIAQEAFPPVLR
jgi:nucleoside-diphosphate-sugar epimerase